MSTVRHLLGVEVLGTAYYYYVHGSIGCHSRGNIYKGSIAWK